MDYYNKKTIIFVICLIIFFVAFALILNAAAFRHTEQLVYVTDTGECYHSASCHYLISSNAIGKNQAESQGYRSCSYCKGKSNSYIEVNNYGTAFGISFIVILVLGPAMYGVVMFMKPHKNRHFTDVEVEYIAHDQKYVLKHHTAESKINAILQEYDHPFNTYSDYIPGSLSQCCRTYKQRLDFIAVISTSTNKTKIRCKTNDNGDLIVFYNHQYHEKIIFLIKKLKNGLLFVPGNKYDLDLSFKMMNIFFDRSYDKLAEYKDGIVFFDANREFPLNLVLSLVECFTK